MKKLVFLFMFVFAFSAFADTDIDNDSPLVWKFRIRFGPFTLGKTIIQISSITNIKGQSAYKLTGHIQSGKGLDKAYLKGDYVSYASDNNFSTLQYSELTYRDPESSLPETEFHGSFDYTNARMSGIRAFKGEKHQQEIDLPGPTREGLSLLFWARQNLGTDAKIETLTLLENHLGITKLTLYSGLESKKIRTRKGKISIPCYMVKGKADYTDFMGFGNKFTLYFTENRELILAKFKIFLGSIILENLNYEIDE